MAIQTKQTPQPLSQLDLIAIAQLIQTGRLAQANERLDAEIKTDPTNPILFNMNAIALLKLKKINDAIDSFDRALTLKPDYIEAMANLGGLYFQDGQMDKALEQYRKIAALKPDYAPIYDPAGDAAQSAGLYEEASEYYKQSIQLNRTKSHGFMGMHRLCLNAGDLQDALTNLKNALEREPENLLYLSYHAILLDYMGESETLQSLYDQIKTKGKPNDKARLDSWLYMKEQNNPPAPLYGSSGTVFENGLKAARADGLILEFGVRHGLSIRQIAALTDQDIHGFDSFEGLPEDWEDKAEGSYSTRGALPHVPDHVHLHAGWFEDTLPVFTKKHKDPVRFINIDCDIYSATKAIFDTLAPQIQSGTVIVFDEYLCNPSWREDEFKAFQESVKQYKWDYEYVCFSLATKQAAVRIL